MVGMTITNRIKASVACLIAGCMVFVVPSIHAKALSVAHLESSVDIAITGINAIVQDYRGFIWVGGSNGLARYDGYTFKVYRNVIGDSHSLSGNLTMDVVESNKRLWISTLEGLNLYLRDKDEFKRLPAEKGVGRHTPSNVSFRLMVDRGGLVWVGTSRGVNIYSPSKGQFINADHINDVVGKYTITSIVEDGAGVVWLGSKFNGLFQYTPKTKIINIYRTDDKRHNSISNNSIRNLVLDQNNHLWIATDKGLNRLDAERKVFTHYLADESNPRSISQNGLWDVYVDKDNDIWVSTDGKGLNVYSRSTNDFERHHHYKYRPDSLGTGKVREFFEDNHGGRWFGTYPSGLDYTNKARRAFELLQVKPFTSNSLISDLVLSLHEDRNHNIWIGTEEGLSRYEVATKKYTNYIYSNKANGLAANAVLALESDNEGNLWIGTWSGGLNKLNLSTGEIVHYMPNDDGVLTEGAVSSRYIWSLTLDRNDGLWIGTEIGIVDRLDLKTGIFEHFNANVGEPGGLSGDFVQNLFYDAQGDVWVATSYGLNRLNAKTKKYENFMREDGNPKSLVQNNVLNIFEDINKTLWFATDGGLSQYDRSNNYFTHLTYSDGLVGETITGVTQDHNNNLWLSSLDGISVVNDLDKSIQNFTVLDGIAGNTANRPALHYSKYHRKVFVGSTKGVTIIDPDLISKNQFVAPIVFTELKVNNVVVDKVGEGVPIKKSITEADVIYLNDQHRMVSITFALLDYSHPLRNSYKYKLNGFDRDWIDSGTNNTANYTNLPSGKYRLVVMGMNSGGVWNEIPAQIDIVVEPPFWLTYWAYIIYLTVLSLFIYLVYLGHKRKLYFEREKVLHFKNIDKIKDQILANTSHELRTPLNGIIGLAETLSREAEDRGDMGTSNKLNTIAFSGKRLSLLVNDILDFSKLGDHSLMLSIRPVNFKEVVQQTFELMQPLLGVKPIKLIDMVLEDTVYVYADSAKLQQVLINLLGNAIKFTERGSISVTCNEGGGVTEIVVEDTGFGISEREINSIFDSFRQVDNYETREQGGSGLGLSVTKKLIDLMNGSISVESKLGSGSIFSFTLPTVEVDWIKENLSKGGKPAELKKNLLEAGVESNESKLRGGVGGGVIDDVYDLVVYSSLHKDDSFIPCFDQGRGQSYTILVVDDDSVNRMVLNGILEKWSFNILEACDGHEALKLIEDNKKIDMIILDLMMPRMSGTEACKEIRKVHSRESLPIIFLSANHNNKEMLKGFSAGGNGFLTKPISRDLLEASVSLHLNILDEYRLVKNFNINGDNQLQSLGDIEYMPLSEAVFKISSVIDGILGNDFELYFWRRIEKKDVYTCLHPKNTSQGDVGFTPSPVLKRFLLELIPNVPKRMLKQDLKYIREFKVKKSEGCIVTPIVDGSSVEGLVVCKVIGAKELNDEMVAVIEQVGLIVLEAVKKWKVLNEVSVS